MFTIDEKVSQASRRVEQDGRRLRAETSDMCADLEELCLQIYEEHEAALAEDADCSRRSGEPPLVSADRFRCALHELRGKLVSALREVATQRRAAREAEEDEAARAREEKLRHALALVEAAAEQV